MRAAIHQPDYFPYLGYFFKIYESDLFLFLDDVPYSNNGFTNWNRIKGPQGELRLKIPVIQTLGDPINRVRTRDELKWKEKHLKTIYLNYKKAEYFEEVYPDLEGLILEKYETISQMNMEIIRFLLKKFHFTQTLETSSSFGITSKKEQRVMDLCKRAGADVYISGNGARAYQSEEHFQKNGIELKYTQYRPYVYPQLWGDFIENLSVIDYLFHCGYHWPEDGSGR